MGEGMEGPRTLKARMLTQSRRAILPSVVGLMLLISLMIFVSYNDVRRLIPT